MNACIEFSVSRLIPIVALLMAYGVANAAEPPRVMFVSGLAVQPVIIDLAGNEMPAKKGMVIPPGFTVKVPEGATMQIMTSEKAIVAVRQNSLLKLEKLGEDGEPHRFKLDVGGIRVANSEKKPHKFEVDTPNAKVKFDKGDHEAYFLKEGRLKDGRWGTFVRGFKDESILTTRDGDAKVTKSVYGYVPGASKDGKAELLDRLSTPGRNLNNPIGNVFPGSTGEILTDLNTNQATLAENTKPVSPDPVSTPQRSFVAPLSRSAIKPPENIVKTPLPGISPIAGLSMPIEKSFTDPARLAPPIQTPKDLFVDKTTNTVVLLDRDKLSLMGTTLEDARNKTITIQEVKVNPPPVVAPPPAGTPITKEQAVSQISTTLKTTNVLKRR